MGYMVHHTIVVTASYENIGRRAQKKARQLGLLVSPLLWTRLNGYWSFFVAPDGSKDGWPSSEKSDLARMALVTWMDTQRYSDGSTPLRWVHVQYADENGVSKIIAHSEERRRCKPGVLR